MKKTLEERFWEKVDVRGEDECWPWMATRSEDGYGQISVMGRMEQAHRVAYMLTKGPIPAGYQVCHSCDFPPCQNPRHLWPGTHLQNSQDCTAKGRQPTGERNGRHTHPECTARGERNGSARLTEDEVREIRRRSKGGESRRLLSESMGVSQRHIGHIVRGEKWKCTKEEPL